MAHKPDHSRSRGVYYLSQSTNAHCLGSSPLARGLPLRYGEQRKRMRIIPARAGFTQVTGGGTDCTEDHPRSRGVYSTWIGSRVASAGSSPLARGLLVRMVDTESPTRIIPARAGFTPSQGRERLPVRDHPRSRGVYGHHIIRTSKLPGSSPLARGLLCFFTAILSGGRIIPARAGFTPACLWTR